MTPIRPWWLLLVPGGLLAGHAIGSFALLIVGHGGAAALDSSIESVLCASAPLALAAVMRAAVAGLRNEPMPISFRVLATTQLAVFVLVEVVEHAGANARPSALVALVLGALAQLLAAAILCALVKGAAAVGQRARTSRPPALAATIPRERPWPNQPVRSTVVPLSLRQRGPPAVLA